MDCWDAEKIFFGGEEYFGQISRDIESAKKTIDVEVYAFELDDLGKSLSYLLIGAAERGVAVRILADGIGSAQSLRDIAAQFKNTKVETRIYHPVFGRGILSVFRDLNRRNHRKTWLFDSHTAYVGSMNIARNQWEDFGLRVEGKHVANLAKAFRRSWEGKARWREFLRNPRNIRSAPDKEGKWIRLNDGLLMRRRNYKLFLKQIRNARQRVWIANAYFAPNLRLVRELCRSAHRGVDVRLLVPSRSDVFFMPWLTSTYYLGLLRAGVKIYEYLPRFFHAKVQVIDDWASLGSSNLNHRSLLHDLEADIHITHPENMKLLEEELVRDFGKSQIVDAKLLLDISWLQSVASRLTLLFKRWL